MRIFRTEWSSRVPAAVLFLGAATLFLLDVPAHALGLGKPESCEVELIWGHTHHITDAIDSDRHSQHAAGQGCYIRDASPLPTAVYQPNYNGHWMSDASNPGYNGGMNPVLSYKNPADPELRLRVDRAIYAQNEEEAFFKIASRMKNEPYELRQSLNAVGFMRMSQYHWAALTLKARDLLRRGKCRSVNLSFSCFIAEQTWKYRLKLAAGDLFPEPSDRELVVDRSGRPVYFTPTECGQDADGAPLLSLPLRCGETHRLDAASIEALSQGSCSRFYEKVSDRFHSEDGWARTAREIYGQ